VPDDERVAPAHVLEIEGFRIGLAHDLEEAEGRPDEFAEELALRAFGEAVDIVLCGHTHVPMTRGLASGMAILNPGSPTMPYGYTHVLGTIATLEIRPGEFEFRVVDLPTGRVDTTYRGPSGASFWKGSRPPPRRRSS
jgi:hypothetical protein